MSYQVNRLINDRNREGKEETFLEILITDDLGTYAYAKWLSDSEHTLLKNTPSKIDDIITGMLPSARSNKERMIQMELNPPVRPNRFTPPDQFIPGEVIPEEVIPLDTLDLDSSGINNIN